jgi:hypothetical protein
VPEITQKRKVNPMRELQEKVTVKTDAGDTIVVARIKKTSSSSSYDECWLGTNEASVCKLGQASGRLSISPCIKGEDALSCIANAVAAIAARDSVPPAAACQRLEAEIQLSIESLLQSKYGLEFGKRNDSASIDGWTSDADDADDADADADDADDAD